MVNATVPSRVRTVLVTTAPSVNGLSVVSGLSLLIESTNSLTHKHYTPGTALWFPVHLQYLLDLVYPAVDGAVQNTRHHQTLHLLCINVELLRHAKVSSRGSVGHKICICEFINNQKTVQLDTNFNTIMLLQDSLKGEEACMVFSCKNYCRMAVKINSRQHGMQEQLRNYCNAGYNCGHLLIRNCVNLLKLDWNNSFVYLQS